VLGRRRRRGPRASAILGGCRRGALRRSSSRWGWLLAVLGRRRSPRAPAIPSGGRSSQCAATAAIVALVLGRLRDNPSFDEQGLTLNN
jgi:hypothetical protein